MNLILVLLLLTGCGKEEAIRPTKVSAITSNGNNIKLDGEWISGCVTDMGTNLQEVFTFKDERLTIDINIFQEENCQNKVASDQVTISFEIIGAFEASLNGKAVLANKVIGTQTLKSTNKSSSFKQAFYIEETEFDLILHHARFQDDGGVQTSDGFPIDIIPIDIVKQ